MEISEPHNYQGKISRSSFDTLGLVIVRDGKARYCTTVGAKAQNHGNDVRFTSIVSTVLYCT
jgi:hypothetical protein